MSAGKTRKVYTPEFKAKVGLEAVRGTGYGVRGTQTINEIGQKYGVHPIRLYTSRSPRRRARKNAFTFNDVALRL